MVVDILERNKNIEMFMYAYMYELEKYLNNVKEELKAITFQSDEANTDRPLKEFLKDVIENKLKNIPDGKSYCVYIDDNEKYCCKEFENIKVVRALLPETLTDDLKNDIKVDKNGVYTNPDIYLEISDGETVFHKSIELKSTKNDSIPGSSVQQIDPEEWVVFIKHTNDNVEVTTGKYICAINSKMQFPDRSPRPQVSFNELKKWNSTYRIFENNDLKYIRDEEENSKSELIKDWQLYLSNKWIETLFSNEIKINEPWFNNNLRKFIILFLDKYEQLLPEEKAIFKRQVKKLIVE